MDRGGWPKEMDRIWVFPCHHQESWRNFGKWHGDSPKNLRNSTEFRGGSRSKSKANHEVRCGAQMHEPGVDGDMTFNGIGQPMIGHHVALVKAY